MANPVTTLVEFEPVTNSGSWVDITDRCFSVVINRPRTAPVSDASTTTLELGLYNHPATAAEITAWSRPGGAGFSPFTHNSPAAAFWPAVTRDRRIRVTAFWNAGANSAVRFLGWTDLWVPDAGTMPPATATVAVTASCVLSRYARTRILSFYGEELLRFTAGAADYWPFDEESPESVELRVKSQNTAALPGQVILPIVNNAGSASLSQPDGGHLTDGQIEFTRGDPSGPSPVVLLPLRNTSFGGLELSVRLTVDPAGLTDDIAAGYSADGTRLWRFTASVTSGTITYRIYDNNDVVQSAYGTNAGRDDAWRWFQLRFTSATTSQLRTRKKGEPGATALGGFGTFADDPRMTRYVVIGGQMPPLRKGKQTNTLQGAVSSVAAFYGTPGTSFDSYTVPLHVWSADQVVSRIFQFSSVVDLLAGGSSQTGAPDPQPVMMTGQPRNLLDLWNEHAVSTNGRLTTHPLGIRQWRQASEIRLSTVALTLDAEQDLSAPAGGWAGIKEERPTRVTVSGPSGSVTVVDAAAETALGMPMEGGTVDTSSGSTTGLKSIAGRLLSADGNRINSFGMDATDTSTSKVTALMALVPGGRIRVTGLNGAYLGYTQTDVYASGWTETYDPDEQTCWFTFDTDPADDPQEAVWDDTVLSRWGQTGSTVTGGTCVGTTGTGTVIITSPTDPLTTSAGEYPMDLDWNGERITVTAPGGATSPQTLTVTARGVAPAVARAHATGETVDVYDSFTWGP